MSLFRNTDHAVARYVLSAKTNNYEDTVMTNTNTVNITTNTKRSSLRKWLLWFVLIDFVIFSTWVMWDIGYLGIWQAGFESNGSLQILIDLGIACFLICSWIVGDARARGVSSAPWIIATFAMGTIAPLAYLLVREYQLDRSEYSATDSMEAA